MVGLLIIPVAGALSLAGEVSGWWAIQRAEQNAADSAVMAAASNANATYVNEGRAVAANYGWVNGSNNTTVTVVNNAACPPPSPTSNCYKVTIQKQVPLYLVSVLGYRGTSNSGLQTILASSTALPATITDFCILALATTGTGINANGNGGGSTQLHGCNLASWSAIDCPPTNNNWGAGTVTAVGGITHTGGCTSTGSNINANKSPAVTNPYGNLPIPTTGVNCRPAAENAWKNASLDFTAVQQVIGGQSIVEYCGNVTVSTAVQVKSAQPGTVVIIKNGSLIINNSSSLTMNPNFNSDQYGVTFIFTGTSGSHLPPTNGTINFHAPTTGTYAGMAFYQDPSVTSNVNFSVTGSIPTWDITGLMYFPNATVTFSGNINASTGGYNCMALVAKFITFNGGTNINEQQSECQQAGLTPPSTTTNSRVSLVQ